MKILRTPDESFADLAGYEFEPHYAEIPDGEGGTLRVHYLDEGPPDAERRLQGRRDRQAAKAAAPPGLDRRPRLR